MKIKSETKELKPTDITKSQKIFMSLGAVTGAIVIGIVIFTALMFIGKPVLPESRSLFTLYDTYNMTILVVFDEEPPLVQFVAPDGSKVDMMNIRYRPGSNFIQYFLPNAMPGNWRMNYDPLSNTEISTPYSVYMTNIFIRDFHTPAVMDENGNIPLSIMVSADESREFHYEIHAVFTADDNSVTEETLLAIGYGMLNEEIFLVLSAEDIRDMGGFMLRLTAYVRHGQASIRDTAWLDLRAG